MCLPRRLKMKHLRMILQTMTPKGLLQADLEPYELTYYMLVNSITPDLDMVSGEG